MKITQTLILAASVLCLDLTGFVHAGPKSEYLLIKKAETEVESEGPKKLLEFEIETQAPIPVDGKSGAFGYAALTNGGNNLLVVVTHLPIDDSSFENPVSGFHTHVLDLKEPTDACRGANFEVDLDNSKKNQAFDADYNWRVKGNKIGVEKVAVADLADAGVETIVSFTLQPILDAKNSPTHLCVNVIDKI